MNISAIKNVNILVRDLKRTEPLWTTDELKKRGETLVKQGEGLRDRIVVSGRGERTRGYTEFKRSTFKFMLDVNLNIANMETQNVLIKL